MSQTKAQLVGGVGISTAENLVVSGISTLNDANITGILTATTAVIGTATTFTEDLVVQGDVRVTGILTVGTSSITIDGTNNQIKVGTGLTLSSDGITAGVITATSFSGDGSGLTGAGSTVADDTTTNATFYPAFTQQTSGTITASKVSTTKFTFNPSSGTLTGTNVNASTDFQLSGCTIVNSGRCLTNIANATTTATANTYVLRGADGKICADSVSIPAIRGASFEGGTLICCSSSVYWIVAPNTSEVSRVWTSRNDANTTAQSVSGCTGWFVATQSQLQNPGYSCRCYWDSYSDNVYWSSTEINATHAWTVEFTTGATNTNRSKTQSNCVRSFRCVTY